jgi:GGDEF domain-containing protein
MNELKKTFVLLVLFLLLVFLLEHIYYGDQALIIFPSHFYFFIVFAVLSTVVVPNLRWLSFYNLLIFWAIMFMIVAGIYFAINGYDKLQIIAIEFLLVEVSILIAYQVNLQLASAESLMDGLALNVYPNRTYTLQSSTERIDVELTRSRRHQRPLTVLVLEPEKVSDEAGQEAYKSLRQDLLRHFVDARLGQLIAERARQTDMILRDRDGKFIILCAETDEENSTILAQRIQQAAQQSMSASLRWGTAVFPKQALTFDELVQKAKENLSE